MVVPLGINNLCTDSIRKLSVNIPFLSIHFGFTARSMCTFGTESEAEAEFPLIFAKGPDY